MTSSAKARRKPMLRKATTAWLCGGDSEVDVVLPDSCPPAKPARTTRGRTRKADLQEGRHSRSTTTTSTVRQGRNRGHRRDTGEGRPHRDVVGEGEGFGDAAQKQKEQGNGLYGASSTGGLRRSRSSDPALLGHLRDWESQALTGGRSRGRGVSRRSNSVDASASIQQQGSHAAENNPINPSFNLGLGAALLFLLSRGATEFHKLVELRKDAEALLNKVQDAVARLETISADAAGSRNTDAAAAKTNCSTTTLSSLPSSIMNKESTTDCCPASTSASPVLSCHSLEDMLLPHPSDACSNSGAADSQARMMEQLEAELESELQRLELTLGTYEDQNHPTGLQEFMNQAEFVREYAVMPWSNGRDYEPSGLLQENRDEDYRHHHQYDGVCPYKLERRLRELLETRQLDSVEHLQYALQSPERSLQDKELEISRWRNEVHLASSHIEPVAGH